MDDKQPLFRVLAGGADGSQPTRRAALPRTPLRVVRTPVIDNRPPAVQLDLFSGLPSERASMLGVFALPWSFARPLRGLLDKFRPSWLVDLRPLNWFEDGGLKREHVFEMFRIHQITYCNGSFEFGIESRDDPRIASGEIARQLCTYVNRNERRLVGPVVVLVSDPALVEPVLQTFPSILKPSPPGGWRPHIFDEKTLSAL